MKRLFSLVAALSIVIAARVQPARAQVRVDNGKHTRWQRFGHDMSYGIVEGLAFAGLDQANNSPPQWGGGTTGYEKRAASNVGEFVIQESVTEGLAAAMKHPLDYTRCGCQGVPARMGHAILGAFLDEAPGGSYSLAVPRIVGSFAGSFAQASWRPDDAGVRTQVALRNATVSLGIGALINMFYEFR